MTTCHLGRHQLTPAAMVPPWPGRAPVHSRSCVITVPRRRGHGEERVERVLPKGADKESPRERGHRPALAARTEGMGSTTCVYKVTT